MDQFIVADHQVKIDFISRFTNQDINFILYVACNANFITNSVVYFIADSR